MGTGDTDTKKKRQEWGHRSEPARCCSGLRGGLTGKRDILDDFHKLQQVQGPFQGLPQRACVRLLKIKIPMDRTRGTTVEISHSLNVGVSVRIRPQPRQMGGFPSRMRSFIVSVITFLLTTMGPHASFRHDKRWGVIFRLSLHGPRRKSQSLENVPMG